MEDIIKGFLTVSNGDGDGNGYGDGSGNGNGDGNGYGDGSGNGNGNGNGDGDGYGYGNGFKMYNGRHVYMIDDTPTLIYSVHGVVHGLYAYGAVLCKDMTLQDCYIARVGDYFAHGKTLKQATADARDKYCRNKPLSERVAEFKSQYPSRDSVCKGDDLFRWHNILTGSCLFGRQEFCREHGIDPAEVTMTVSEFIDLTVNAYGGKVIEQLREIYD